MRRKNYIIGAIILTLIAVAMVVSILPPVGEPDAYIRRVNYTRDNMQAIADHFGYYKSKYKIYPSVDSWEKELHTLDNLRHKPELKIRDGWNRPYKIEYVIEKRIYRIISYGEDGELGGKDEGKDIVFKFDE